MKLQALPRLLMLAPLSLAIAMLLGSATGVAASAGILAEPVALLEPELVSSGVVSAQSGVGSAAMAAQDVSIQARSTTDIYNRFDALKPTYAGTAYSSTPSWAAPYAAGSLTSGFASDGIKALNFFRFVAGLPDDVVLDSTEQNRGMHGAVLLAASTFSHTPPKPGDMPQAFYDLGLSSTSRSNIGSGHLDLESFQLACMDDDSAGNIPMVGHRRWILNPRMAKTGMGFANNRSTTYAFDTSRAAVDYDFVAWPPAGPMPAQLFGSSVPWSLTLNPARYDWTSDPHTVTLRRTRDGASWTFTASDTNTSGEYFAFNTGGYGVSNCFIFRPTPSSVTYQPGDVFEATLSGGIYLEGTTTPATVRYTTTFITLGRPDAYEDDDSAASAKSLASGVAAAHTIDYSTDEDWHSFAASADTSYGFSLTSVAANGSITVAIYDGSTRLFEKTVSGAYTFNWMAPATKTYTLKVTGRASSRLAVVSYTIRYGDPVSDPGVPVSVTNVAGANRYQTAVEASKKAFPSGGVSTVVIATGANWPDALGGASLAGALGGPILLTAPSYLPTEVKAEITRLGASKAIILGGTASVSSGVEATLRAKLGASNVERIAGPNRYETARLVARRTVGVLGTGYSGRAFVATGANFPDALGASPLAAARGWPIYLVNPASGVDAALASALKANGVKDVVVLGSTAAVSSRVQSDLTAKAACTTARLGGANRYATALAVAEYGVTAAGLHYDAMAVATGQNFPDALAGGVLQGRSGSVLLLTPSASLNAEVEGWLTGVAGTVSEVRFLGGTTAVSNAVRTRVLDLLF